MNVWTEHRNPEGRTYWFNTTTRESVWEKPDDLKTPFEKALNNTKWKEYFSGGRKYYYNTETKESKWDMPEELLLLLEKVEKEKSATPTPAPSGAPGMLPAPAGFTPIGQAGALVPGMDLSVALPTQNGLPISTATTGALPARPNLPEDPVIPHNGFATLEEGEKAFTHLLRKAGVDASWTWDMTMRTIITDPLYKALNTLAEKKNCWQKYVDGLKAKEQEEREARLAKLRPALRNMLKGNPNVHHYSTFATADRLFANHPIWQQAKIAEERKLIFEEYIGELKQREMQEQRAARSRAISTVVALFKQLDVDVLTRWRQAHQMLINSEEWKSNPDLANLPTLDILLAFEDYSRVREREFEEQMRKQQLEKTRKERKAREGFKALLAELVQSGILKARTKWKQIYPSIKDDDRYLNILGNPGSNPLELFWDIVDDMDQKLDAKIATVDAALRKAAERKGDKADGADKEKGEVEVFEVKPETTEEEFKAAVEATGDQEVRKLTSADITEIFRTKLADAQKKQDEERKRAERKQRHMQDDLRYALKKLPEPLDVNMSYEDAIPLMQDLPEFKALEDDGRRAAFAKFIKRQKERLREASDDGGSTTSRKRKEPHREKDDYRSERDHHRHSYHDDYDRHRTSTSRDYYKDREYSRGDRDHREKDYKDYRDYARDSKDYYKSSRSKYESEREERDRDRRRDKDRDRRSDDPYVRERDNPKPTSEHGREERERSVSLGYRDREGSTKRDYDDRHDDRVDKVRELFSDRPCIASEI
ncbi:hypothetical protein PUNSTDRAFT_54329 [Punctularia strigosozonata HHB-11173 SS5]|uniref:uncharacterized protein n=1 Tax=Punctularia strigosozonata (strain HHB-11173) TaxID=741275 RepID=UPI0004417B27|nr:uncharacterized protein PUNSTDRAFT_54329 [Punctularia strigosozonata HHB-11173 SS5]EIN06033.1 hypothetical protein PUNSTDRAFT_54329 [Punctularia strigosozonata HHB-11173 SS5]